MQRKVVALLFGDIAGYTRLIAADEQQATIDVREVFDEIVMPGLASNNGQLIQMEGDGFFAEFESPYDAVKFGITLQRKTARQNLNKIPGREIQFRVGINYGEVIVDPQNGRLSGTAVNIAARLENIADVGGIWVSERVVKEIGDVKDIEFVTLGSRRLKNIVGRIPVFGVMWNQERGMDTIPAYHRSQFPAINATIAVLPFRVFSDRTSSHPVDQSIVEDIMTELGRFSEISIVSSDAMSIHSHEGPNVREMGRKLDADYLLTGSISRYATDIRIHARLFETETGGQVWADRYDSGMKDIFMLHDRVAQELASKLPLRIENASLTRAHRKSLDSLDAYDCYLQGRALYREKNELTDRQAIVLLERAIKLDPDFADPYAVLGAIHSNGWAYSCWGTDPRQSILKGQRLIKKALSLNQNLPRAHAHLAWTYLITSEFDEAREAFDTALSLNPNDSDVLLLKAYANIYMGEPEECIRICRILMDANPRYPDWYTDALGGGQFIAGDYEHALQSMLQVDDLFPESKAWIAACQAHLGMFDEASIAAQEFVARAQEIWRGSSECGASDYVDWFLNQACPFAIESDRQKIAGGLQKVGLSSSLNSGDVF